MVEKIKEILKANDYDFPIGSKYGDLGDICTLWYTLEQGLNLDFTVNVAGNDEQYLEAVYWSDKLGASIILDSGIMEEYETLEELAEELDRLNNRIEEIKARLK